MPKKGYKQTKAHIKKRLMKMCKICGLFYEQKYPNCNHEQLKELENKNKTNKKEVKIKCVKKNNWNI